MAATNRPANISKYKWAKDKDRIVQPLYDAETVQFKVL